MFGPELCRNGFRGRSHELGFKWQFCRSRVTRRRPRSATMSSRLGSPKSGRDSPAMIRIGQPFETLSRNFHCSWSKRTYPGEPRCYAFAEFWLFAVYGNVTVLSSLSFVDVQVRISPCDTGGTNRPCKAGSWFGPAKGQSNPGSLGHLSIDKIVA